MLTALASGILLGLAAGLAPGPLLALVLAQTLRHGVREGCKIALTPLITDAPIILVTLVFAVKLTELRLLLGSISIAGGVFVLYLAWESLRPGSLGDVLHPSDRPQAWFKGILTNLLSPHPWLFWLTVGAATLARSIAHNWIAAALFLFGFYLLLVGCKVLIALLAGQSRNLLTGRPYRWVMRVLAVLLGVLGVLLFLEGLRHLALV